jgi:hypothetical protein
LDLLKKELATIAFPGKFMEAVIHKHLGKEEEG